MKNYLIVALAAALSGAAITKYYWPTERSTEVEVVRNNVVTETREITKADGTKEVVTVVTDKTTKKETATVVAVSTKPKYHVSISATRSLNYLTGGDVIYGAQLDYNVLGPVTLGVRADTSKQFGLVIGVAF